MSKFIKHSDKGKAEEIAMANRQRRDAELNSIFDKYDAAMKSIAVAASSLSEAVGILVDVDKRAKSVDPSNNLSIDVRLRVKVVLNAINSMHRMLNRISLRMRNCAAGKNSILDDSSDNRQVAFE